MPHDLGSLEEQTLRAVASTYWAWIIFDAVEFRRSRAGLSSESAKRIAGQYRVSRTVLIGSYPTLADEINKMVMSWKGNLVDKARECVALVSRKKEKFPKKPLSAVSKLAWFADPSDWTLFDSYAVRGAGIRNVTTEDRFIAYYSKLNNSGFVSRARELREELKRESLPFQMAERTLDWWIMYKGNRLGPWDQDSPDWTRTFLETLNPKTRNSLMNFAEAAAPVVTRFAEDLKG